MGKTTMKLNLVSAFTVSAILGMGAQGAVAQEDTQTMPGMNGGSMSNMDSDSMQQQHSMPGMNGNAMPDKGNGGMQQQHSMPGMNGGSMSNMDSDSMQHQHSMPGMNGNAMPDKGNGGMPHQQSMPGMNGSTSSMGSGGMQGHGAMPGMTMQGNGNAVTQGGSMSGDMAGMSGMSADSMNTAAQATGTRDPHAYSDGYTLEGGAYALPGPRQMRLADEHNFASLLVDRLETVRTSDAMSTAYDMQAWFGRDYDRAVLRAEGEYSDGKLQEGKTELLWSHAVSPFWDTHIGIRHDSGEEPDRNWLALGVQGLAPYWFELDATAYAAEGGHSLLSLNAEYEMLFTQRLILTPRMEANFYGKEDAERGIGAGLSNATAGLRLRYEIRREFAPYIGVEWAGLYGKTADYARDAGVATTETRLLAGLRFWF